MPTQSEISMNPLSAKGQILTHDGSSRISVSAGTNGQVLVSSSTSTSGLVWTTFSTAASFGVERIASGTITSTSYQIANIPSTYQHLKLFIWGVNPSSWFDQFELQGLSAGNNWKGFYWQTGASLSTERVGDNGQPELYTQWRYGSPFNAYSGSTIIDIFNYSDTDKGKGIVIKTVAAGTSGSAPMVYLGGGYGTDTSAVSSIYLYQNGGTGNGTWLLHGIRRFGE